MKKLFQLEFEQDAQFKTPREIIKAQCDFLSQDTGGLVLGRVEDYSGEIDNYRKIGLQRALSQFSRINEDIEVNIQSELGELSENIFTYDFFLTSKFAPNYKYRVMFFRYGIGGYPVKVVYDEDIDIELSVSGQNDIQTEEEFEKFLSAILSSEKFLKIVNNIYVLNKKLEFEEAF